MAGRITGLSPMLAVTDLPRSIRFYTEKLGFTVRGTFGEPPVWCSLFRDGWQVMLNAPPRERVERDVPRASKDYQIFYFYTDDAPALREEFAGRGVQTTDLRVTIYRMKEFEVRDPDDYWLWFGQDTDEPPTECEE